MENKCIHYNKVGPCSRQRPFIFTERRPPECNEKCPYREELGLGIVKDEAFCKIAKERIEELARKKKKESTHVRIP